MGLINNQYKLCTQFYATTALERAAQQWLNLFKTQKLNLQQSWALHFTHWTQYQMGRKGPVPRTQAIDREHSRPHAGLVPFNTQAF